MRRLRVVTTRPCIVTSLLTPTKDDQDDSRQVNFSSGAADLFIMTGRILSEIDRRLPLYRTGPLKSVLGLLENLTMLCHVGCEECQEPQEQHPWRLCCLKRACCLRIPQFRPSKTFKGQGSM